MKKTARPGVPVPAPLAALLLASVSGAQGADCAPGWTAPFDVEPAAFGHVEAFAVFDDGSGPALYGGGHFTFTGAPGSGRSGVARWEGTSWAGVGPFPAQDEVRALAVFDDGNGPALYQAGQYPLEVSRWDGTTWTDIGSVPAGDDFNALCVFDDGGGPALYAAGNFTSVGGVPAEAVARWDGATWSVLGGGVAGAALCLAVYDDGSGPALFVGGTFQDLGGVPGKIGRWDGTSWSSVSAGMNGVVRALAAYDDGGGSRLWAGGDFTTASGQTVNHVASWGGSSWTGAGVGTDAPVEALTVFDGGGGDELYAGGFFTAAGGQPASGAARWDGASWQALDPSAPGGILGFGAFDDGDGPVLHMGRFFGSSTNVLAWDGATITTLPTATNSELLVAEVIDDGSGPTLYVGGTFSQLSGAPIASVAQWDGTGWAPMGSTAIGTTRAFVLFDDGTGSAVCAGTDWGVFRWDGADWVSLNGPSGVRALTVFDDGQGGGPTLYAGGTFTQYSGQPMKRVGRLGATGWEEVGGGFTGGGIPSVTALVVHDDGAGARLFAAGANIVSTVEPFARDVAAWDGVQWHPVGNNGDGLTTAYGLTVCDLGSGPVLYASGSSSFDPVRAWNGQSWSVTGHPGSFVSSLDAADDAAGGGPALFGGAQNSGLLWKYDGASWTSTPMPFGAYAVHSIEPAQGIGGPAARLLVAGDVMLDAWGSACDVPTIYCTAKPSSAGCVASVGTTVPTGQPASGAADYSVTATEVQGFKNGHLFVGISGPAAIPFLGGTLCVLPPTKRGPTMNSGGTGPTACDGSYAMLVNDGAIIPFGHDAGPGNSAWYQWWYRDPENGPGTLGSSFSNAVRLDFD